MSTTTRALTATAAIDLGGKDWTSGNGRLHRIYLNSCVWAPLISLDVERYKTGNISSATLAGEDISNAEAGRILESKAYVQDDVLRVDTPAHWTTADEIADAILAAAEKATA